MPGENAGTYSIGRGTLSLNSNYILNFTGASFEIAPRPVTVKADGIAAVYGDPYLLTYKVTSGHWLEQIHLAESCQPGQVNLQESIQYTREFEPWS